MRAFLCTEWINTESRMSNAEQSSSRWLDPKQCHDLAKAATEGRLLAHVDAILDEFMEGPMRRERTVTEERNELHAAKAKLEGELMKVRRKAADDLVFAVEQHQRAERAEAKAREVAKHLVAEEGARVRETKALREEVADLRREVERLWPAFA